jgi:hypothetical protein
MNAGAAVQYLRGVEVSSEDGCESVRSIVNEDVHHSSRQQVCQEGPGGEREVLGEGCCRVKEALLHMTYLACVCSCVRACVFELVSSSS